MGFDALPREFKIIIMGVLGAFIIALFVAILFSPYKRSDSFMPLFILFLVLFAAGIAAQFWIVPFGPVFWGVSWLRILFIVFIFALLFSTPAPHRRSRVEDATDSAPAAAAIGILVWLILLVLIVAIIIGIYYSESLQFNGIAT